MPTPGTASPSDYPANDPRAMLPRLAAMFVAKYNMTEPEAQRQAAYYLRNPNTTMSQAFIQEMNESDASAGAAKLAAMAGQGAFAARKAKIDANREAYINSKLANMTPGRIAVDDGSHGTPGGVGAIAQAADDVYNDLNYNPNGKPNVRVIAGPGTRLTGTDKADIVAGGAVPGALAGAVPPRLPPAPLAPQTIAIPAMHSPQHDEDADLATWQRYADLLFSKPTGSPARMAKNTP